MGVCGGTPFYIFKFRLASVACLANASLLHHPLLLLSPLGEHLGDTLEISLIMQRFTDQDDHNGDDLNIPNARPRAPTPSALPPSFQYSPSVNSPSSPYAASTMTPVSPPSSVPLVHGHGHTSSTASARTRSQSVSAGRPSTPAQSNGVPSTAPLSPPDEYTADPHPLPITPPPNTFARPPKYPHPPYADPAGFPTPPSYPPVPALVASGSSSTSTRSSAYTSPGASAPLSSNDLSTVGLGLGRYASREDEHDSPYTEDDAIDIGAAVTTDKPISVLPLSTLYHQSIVRESSESSISRLQFATNAAAAATAANGNGISHGWSERYAPSTRSGDSSYEGTFLFAISDPPLPFCLYGSTAICIHSSA